MDIADHVVADQRLRVPDTGAATFEVLGEVEVLPHDLAAALARMVGFRNILVHDYARLDPAIVIRVLTAGSLQSTPCLRTTGFPLVARSPYLPSSGRPRSRRSPDGHIGGVGLLLRRDPRVRCPHVRAAPDRRRRTTPR